MNKGQTILEVLSPRGNVEAPPDARPASPRLPGLAGKRIAVINNGKVGAGSLLPFLLDALERRAPGIELRVWDVPLALPLETRTPLLHDIARNSDAAIALLAD
ncbi:MAG: hypothetical protein HY673_03845 [Chloroflexi bacterium]|nr:hypothetical protein [Chloroflexota bacterium]